MKTALILLPAEYNPDEESNRKPVPMGKFQDTCVEIAKNFDGCTFDPFPKYGFWKKSGYIDIQEDVNVIIEIDRVSEAQKKNLINYCRDKLLDRFQQEAILIKFIPQVQAELVKVKKKGGNHEKKKET